MPPAIPPILRLLIVPALLLAPLASTLAQQPDVPAEAVPPPPQEEELSVPYEVELTGVEDSGLAELLRGASTLFGLKDDPPPSLIGLERRADSDRERLEMALRSAGHYDGRLDIRIDAEAQPVKVTVAVEPGPAYTFKTIELRTAGGEPIPGAAITATDIGLERGAQARAPEVLAAEGRLRGLLAGRGHAFAKVADRQVVVDHSDRTMDVTFIVDAGPLTRFGAAEVRGLKRLDESLIHNRVTWTEGQIFEPAQIDSTRQKIASLGTFQTVRVQLAEQPGPDGLTPVTITLAERPVRVIGAGIDYSTVDGLGGKAYWAHRNLFGGGEQTRLQIEVGRLSAQSAGSRALQETDLRFSANFRKPDFLAPLQSLVLSFAAVSENPPAYERVAGILTAALERELTDHLRASAGISSQRGRVQTKERSYQVALVGLPVGFTYDGTDSLLNPVRGYRLGATVTPWFPVTGNDTQSNFIATSVTGSTYYDFTGEGRYVGAARLGVGSIIGGGLTEIPPDRRFYAGGGGSVRGYGFQLAGPRNRFGDPTGGRSLLEGGLELRVKVTENIGVVPFVDAGTVYDRSFPDFSEPLRIGTGLGVRYYTDFGPLRVDVGIPLNPERGDARWQLYISLGQAF